MEIVRLEPYSNALKKLNASEAEIIEAEDNIAANPLAGVSVAGSARKLRFKMAGRGKSGGGRLIYYYAALDEMVFLLTVYDKTKKSNLTEDDKKAMKKQIKTLENELRKVREQ